MAEPDIVVIGRRGAEEVWFLIPDQNIWQSMFYNDTTNQWENGPTSATPPEGVVDDPSDNSDNVKVSVANPANKQKALKAAANLINALKRVNAKLSSANGNAIITINGRTMTVAQVRDLIKNTRWSVGDKSFTNGGGGEAKYSADGKHSVEWNYLYFDGDGSEDYAHPNYVNGQGMNAVVLHDVAHVTAAGNAFNVDSRKWFREDDTVSGEFGYSAYWINNEAFAHDLARTIANTAGIDISGWTPTEGFDWQSPRAIYLENGND